jgi:uncharacterized membrane-anchored protein
MRETSILSKVPPVTIGFWVAKILATTIGETGGDALSMTLKLGYGLSSAIFFACFLVLLAFQVRSKRYHPVFYWAVVVATTTVGTTMSDYLDRTLALGYPRSSMVLFVAVLAALLAWRMTTGAVRVDRVTAPADEAFYWLTILVSNTLGTALGYFAASTSGLGFGGGAAVFAGLLLLVAAARLYRLAPGAVLFWAAYVLTRPLGATLGDALTKSRVEGGLSIGRFTCSLALAGGMIVLLAFTARRGRSTAA